MSVTIKDALHAAANKKLVTDEAVIDAKVHELVCLTLFDIANSPDVKVRGSMLRATRAQKTILNRMVGRRRAGTHPAVRGDDTVKFIDLTQGVLEA